jgi:hypothetical protein
VENKARQLLELIEDIRMAAGNDSAHHALEVYADFKAAVGRTPNRYCGVRPASGSARKQTC